MRKLTRISLSMLSGILLVVSFPPAEFSTVIFISLIPLILALDGVGYRASFFFGWIAGLTYFTGVVWWVTEAVINYGYLPVPVGWAVLFLMTSVLALYPAVFGMVTCWAHRRRLSSGPAGVLFIPAAWTALEWVRGNFFFMAFPWANLAYSQYLNLPFIQSASFAGPYGPGFIVAAANVGLLCFWRVFRGQRGRRRFEAAGFVLALFLFSVNWVWGALRLEENAVEVNSVRIAVLQGNIDQGIKWNKSYREATVKNYEDLSRAAAEDGAELIIWPESAAPFYYQNEVAYQRRMTELVKEIGRPVLFGAPGFEVINGKIRLKNRAYYLRKLGLMAGYYDKIHLVPFGEYVPFKNLLFFAGKLVEEVGDFTPGKSFELFDLDGESFGTVICYEIIFPDLVRRFAKEGATFMTNITNDAWYGRTSASHQHFTQMVFRAVENNQPIARAANTGISGFVDATGRIMMTSGLFERGYYLKDIQPGRKKTFYTRYGDVFAWLCVSVMAVWALWITAMRVRSGLSCTGHGRRKNPRL